MLGGSFTLLLTERKSRYALSAVVNRNTIHTHVFGHTSYYTNSWSNGVVNVYCGVQLILYNIIIFFASISYVCTLSCEPLRAYPIVDTYLNTHETNINGPKPLDVLPVRMTLLSYFTLRTRAAMRKLHDDYYYNIPRSWGEGDKNSKRGDSRSRVNRTSHDNFLEFHNRK